MTQRPQTAGPSEAVARVLAYLHIIGAVTHLERISESSNFRKRMYTATVVVGDETHRCTITAKHIAVTGPSPMDGTWGARVTDVTSDSSEA